ncbi:family 20 glycosylhydrolase [Actinokineospora soli]|uniref:beta-N-acetylhexosaminidase n=1 Tax=Actinokineospora soli TaxID=1048753 RepID=A0ABW2TKS6_9PSEU
MRRVQSGRASLLATVVAVFVGVSGAAAPAVAGEERGTALGLVPLPVVVEHGAGGFVVRPSVAVVVNAAARGVGEGFAAQLRAVTGYRVPVRTRGAGIRITVDPRADYTVDGAAPADESYLLDVDRRGVAITARTAHGAFNGVQTLRQLIPVWGGTIPAVHIEDQPRFPYRGVMLDVARSFQDVDDVKRYIDSLSALKMSVLHLHLADDQGWRIEITNDGKAPGDPIDYTALTRVSGATAMTQQGYRAELGRTGYYTQAQYRDIVAYARERFVTVVPEVDIPGHTNAALHAIPQLNTDRSLPKPNPATGVVDWNGTGNVGYSALDERLDLTYTFVEHVFTQLAELTGGPYVHIGGDESHAMGHTRYVDFITRAVPRVQAATGVGTMGWTEYAEAGLAQGPGYWDGSVVQYWIGSGDWVRDFVAKGGKAVVSAAAASYLDQKYTKDTPIGLSWACKGTCDFERYYDWDPTTTVTGGIAEEAVLGVEGPLWSETIRGADQAQFLTFPRAAAVLETGWTPATRKDVADFAARLAALGPASPRRASTSTRAPAPAGNTPSPARTPSPSAAYAASTPSRSSPPRAPKPTARSSSRTASAPTATRPRTPPYPAPCRPPRPARAAPCRSPSPRPSPATTSTPRASTPPRSTPRSPATPPASSHRRSATR